MLAVTQVTDGFSGSAYTASQNENPVLNKHHLSQNENPALNKHHLSVFIVVRPTVISVSQYCRVTFYLWLGMFVFATRLAVGLTSLLFDGHW